MIIDSTSYGLLPENYIPIKTEKKRIIIGNTFNSEMKHVIGWKNRLNGHYKKTAQYTITKDGRVYNHFDTDYYSHFFKGHDMNAKSIIILIENEGWLSKDENNEFITLIGNIYNKPHEVYEKKWRGFNYWAPYTEEQVESAVELVEFLCKKHNIKPRAVSHNTKLDLYGNTYGVFYRSNLEKFHTDVNPNWFFEQFKTKLESYEQQANDN